MSAVRHIRTRFAIVKRAEKILGEIDKLFEDAADYGLSVAEADPHGELTAMRKGLIAMLEREGRLGIVRTTPSTFPSPEKP